MCLSVIVFVWLSLLTLTPEHLKTFHTCRILFTANAQFPGSRMVKTGVLLGICKVEWIFTSISALSENGGQPKVGKSQLAATNPDNAFDRPAMVIYTISFSSLFAVKISKTFNGCLCAHAACCSQAMAYSSSLLVIFFACGSSDVEPIISIVFMFFPF